MRNDKDYYESLCKKCLIHFWPEKYRSFSKHECPNWISNDVGVEVRRVMKDGSGGFDAFIKRYLGKPVDKTAIKCLRKYGFYISGISLKTSPLLTLRSDACGTIALFLPKNKDNYLLAGGFLHSDYISHFGDFIASALEDKLNLLNAHYDLRSENNVFLILEEQLNYLAVGEGLISRFVFDIVVRVKGLYSQIKNKHLFNHIYLLFCDNLININTNEWHYSYSRHIIGQALFRAIHS